MATTLVSSLSDDFKRRAKAKLDEASSGRFLQSSSARLLPSFNRSAAAADASEEEKSDEITLGVLLGVGSFADVHEITAVVLRRKSDSPDDDEDLFLPQPDTNSVLPESSFKATDEADFPLNVFRSQSEIRNYMSENCIRKDNIEGDQARYALKKMQQSNGQKQLEQGLIDISLEAQFLARIDHPNIIKMRGIAGKPLTPSFGLVLDRLYSTLEDRMDIWTEEMKESSSGGICRCFGGSVDSSVKEGLFVSAVTVAYDLSCAMRYIHSNNLVYRDIKPENAGFDVRGDIKLFDFGFCKELQKKLLDKPSGFYKLTKMTGSQPYMAPENFLGKPYGKKVDVFSFGVLLWEMIHCKFAFYKYNKLDYKDLVVERNWRPSIDKSISTRMNQLIKDSWDPDPKKRPEFDRISLLLRGEYQESSRDLSNDGGLTRSEKMLSASVRSFTKRSRN